MVKAELIERIAASNPDLSGAKCQALVNAFFEAMSDHLVQHGRIELRGFAAFSVAPPSQGRKHNPRNREPVDASTRPRIKFRPSSVLVEAIAPR
jgi:integration host factor subunit beta